MVGVFRAFYICGLRFAHAFVTIRGLVKDLTRNLKPETLSVLKPALKNSCHKLNGGGVFTV
jgi:NADH:ubiquinone oxidoreductase subunit D